MVSGEGERERPLRGRRLLPGRLPAAVGDDFLPLLPGRLLRVLPELIGRISGWAVCVL